MVLADATNRAATPRVLGKHTPTAKELPSPLYPSEPAPPPPPPAEAPEDGPVALTPSPKARLLSSLSSPCSPITLGRAAVKARPHGQRLSPRPLALRLAARAAPPPSFHCTSRRNV